MAYTHTALSTLIAALAARLHDTAYVFWTAAELQAYLLESLRTWNAASAFYRDRMTFSLTAGTCFYDLASVAGTLLARTVTDADVMKDIEYHLLEPAVVASWTGTEQFVFADVVDALQRRRNQFLLETGCVLTHSTLPLTSDSAGRLDLLDTAVDVRRAAFGDAAGVYTRLWRDDEWAMQSFSPGWEGSPGPPKVYSMITTPPVRLQLSPIPIATGTLDLLTVDTGAALDPATGVVLGVPDDFAWVVKWGAMADLLGKDGPARDPERASYAEQRWLEGIELARFATTALQAQINGVRKTIETVSNLDKFRAGWQGNTAATPDVVAMAGLNMLAVADPPDAAHSVTLDVVRNFPVPATTADQVLVGREHLDVILDYAEHLAAFKMAGAEFQATAEHYKRFFQLASEMNDKWRAAAVFADVLHDRTRQEEEAVPSRRPAQPLGLSADMG